MVFRAWTDPKQMVQWWSPADIECRNVEADLKVGGAHRIHMVSEKGDHVAIGEIQADYPEPTRSVYLAMGVLCHAGQRGDGSV